LHFETQARTKSSTDTLNKFSTEKLAPAASLVRAFTIKGLEQGWLAQCQFKVTEWVIMFICDMVLQCAGFLNPSLSLEHAVTVYLTTSSKLLINDVKPDHSHLIQPVNYRMEKYYNTYWKFNKIKRLYMYNSV